VTITLSPFLLHSLSFINLGHEDEVMIQQILKMKRICITSFWMVSSYFLLGQVQKDSVKQQPAAKDSFYTLSPVEVRAVRANEHAPVTKTNI
jgi:hypothetical protein